MTRGITRLLLTAASTALAAVAALAGCAGDTGGTPVAGPPSGPQELQAESVANQEFGLLAGGGWAQAWTLWSSDAQQAISQADFVRLNRACKPVLGTPWTVTASAWTGPDAVRVDWTRAGTVGSNALLYQRGAWRFAPDAASVADYRRGVETLVRERNASGACH